MKLWKKILIGFFILAIIGIGLAAYGVSKISDTYTEKIEPEMKRYVQMTKEEQDKYLITQMEEIIVNVGDPEDLQSFRDDMNNDPEFRQVFIDFERSFCANFIVRSKDIFSGLSPEDKVAYFSEKEEYWQRSDRLKELQKQKRAVESDD